MSHPIFQTARKIFFLILGLITLPIGLLGIPVYLLGLGYMFAIIAFWPSSAALSQRRRARNRYNTRTPKGAVRSYIEMLLVMGPQLLGLYMMILPLSLLDKAGIEILDRIEHRRNARQAERDEKTAD